MHINEASVFSQWQTRSNAPCEAQRDRHAKDGMGGLSGPLSSLLAVWGVIWDGQCQPYPLPMASLSTDFHPLPSLSRRSLAGDDLLARSPAERHRGKHLPLEAVQPAGGGRVHPLLHQLLGQPFQKQDGQLLPGKWQWWFSLSLTFTFPRACWVGMCT